MAEQFSDTSATRIIAALDTRNERRAKNGGQVAYTWGTVGAVDAGNKYASAYINGETDGAYMSEGFRIPSPHYVNIGQKVKVGINYATDDRWIEEVLYPNSTYKRVAISSLYGYIFFGGGGDVFQTSISGDDLGTMYIDGNAIQLSAPLTTDDSLIINSPTGLVRVQTSNSNALLIGPLNQTTNVPFRISNAGLVEWGSGAAARDTNLYRNAANQLGTDDALHIKAVTDVTLSEAIPPLMVGAVAGANVAIDGNEIMARNAGATAALAIQADGGRLTLNANNAPTTSTDDGLLIGGDVNLYRAGANILATDDTLNVGQPLTGSNGVQINSGGSIEILSTNPYIDFKNASGDDYDARIIYNLSSSNKLEFYGVTSRFNTDVEISGNLTIEGPNEGSFDTFAITNGGTATFGSKVCRWYVIGKIVVFRISFSVTANGSGASNVTVGAFTGMPSSTTTARMWGDRGGVGVTAIVGRWSGASITTIQTLAGAAVTGADLVSGAGYTFVGCYVTT